LFSGGLGVDVVYQGFMVAGLVLISYFLGAKYLAHDNPAAHGMTMAFLTMSMAEIFHSFNMRSQRKSLFTMKEQNKWLWFAAIGSFLATALVCEVKFLADAFGFAPVGIVEFLVAIGIGVCIIPIVEVVKFVQRKREKKANKNS
jgi:Ca2+-transporting ATPase